MKSPSLIFSEDLGYRKDFQSVVLQRQDDLEVDLSYLDGLLDLLDLLDDLDDLVEVLYLEAFHLVVLLDVLVVAL